MHTSSPLSVPVPSARFGTAELKVEAAPVTRNRIRAVMAHTTRYAFKAEARLAQDASISASALNRLINGHTSPSYFVVSAIAYALEGRLGRRLDPRDLVSTNGRYPTLSLQELCGCRGCAICRQWEAQENLNPVS